MDVDLIRTTLSDMLDGTWRSSCPQCGTAHSVEDPDNLPACCGYQAMIEIPDQFKSDIGIVWTRQHSLILKDSIHANR